MLEGLPERTDGQTREDFPTLVHALAHEIERHPDRTALVCGGRSAATLTPLTREKEIPILKVKCLPILRHSLSRVRYSFFLFDGKSILSVLQTLSEFQAGFSYKFGIAKLMMFDTMA